MIRHLGRFIPAISNQSQSKLSKIWKPCMCFHDGCGAHSIVPPSAVVLTLPGSGASCLYRPTLCTVRPQWCLSCHKSSPWAGQGHSRAFFDAALAAPNIWSHLRKCSCRSWDVSVLSDWIRERVGISQWNSSCNLTTPSVLIWNCTGHERETGWY